MERYCCACDYYGRAQLIRVRDAVTNTLLSEQPVTALAGGQYLVWKVRGHVKFEVINNGGVNAVVSGIFIDPAVETTKFVYDEGWNLLAELDGGNRVQRQYLWGRDLSGTRAGAGGIGGLLAMRDRGTGQVHGYAYDGNGNVRKLMALASGAVSAEYEYGPFGEALRATGAMAANNPLRYSSKYQDETTYLIYYGRRFYDPEGGRWLSKDPLGVAGGINLFAAMTNNGVNFIDPIGLSSSHEGGGKFYKHWLFGDGNQQTLKAFRTPRRRFAHRKEKKRSISCVCMTLIRGRGG